MKTQIHFKIFVLIATAALMTACGSEKEMNSSEFSSRVATPSAVDESTRPLAYCNKGTGSLIDVNYGVFSRNGQIVTDKIYAKVTKIPTGFANSTNYIQFFAWQTNSSGYTSGADFAFYFDIIDMNTGNTIATNKRSLYWNDLKALATQLGVSTPADFFRKVRILVNLEDYDGEYDVVRADYFDMNNKMVDRTDALLPTFDADPARYAVESNGATRAANLQALHPFRSMANQGWSANKYKAEAQKFCSPLNTTAY